MFLFKDVGRGVLLQDAEAAADEYESEPEEAEDDSADDKEVQPASKKRGRPKKAEADINEEDMEAPKNLIPAPKDGAVFERTPPPGRRLTIKRLWYDSVPGEDEEFVPGDDSEFMEVPKKQGRHKKAAAGSKVYKYSTSKPYAGANGRGRPRTDGVKVTVRKKNVTKAIIKKRTQKNRRPKKARPT